MKYLLYSEYKILVLVKYFRDISWLPRKPPTSTRGALVARSTECDAQHSMVLLEKSAASGSGCVLSIRPSLWSSGPRPRSGRPCVLRSSDSARSDPTPGQAGSGVGRDLGHGGSGARGGGWRQVSRAAGEEGRPRGVLPGAVWGRGSAQFRSRARRWESRRPKGRPPPLGSVGALQLRGNCCHRLQPGCAILAGELALPLLRPPPTALLFLAHRGPRCIYHLSFLSLKPLSRPFRDAHAGVSSGSVFTAHFTYVCVYVT